MKVLHRLAASAAAAGLLVLTAGEASAQRPAAGGGFRVSPPPRHGGHFRGRHFHAVPFFVVEREIVRIIEREVVRDDQPAKPPVADEPAAPPRKPYVIGATYASLPAGCMKLIEDGASYYYCSGEWYRQLAGGSHAQYRAVARP